MRSHCLPAARLPRPPRKSHRRVYQVRIPLPCRGELPVAGARGPPLLGRAERAFASGGGARDGGGGLVSRPETRSPRTASSATSRLALLRGPLRTRAVSPPSVLFFPTPHTCSRQPRTSAVAPEHQ